MDSALEQMAIVAGALLGGIVLAWALFSILGGASRRARREVVRARGAERPDWAPGIWICAACRSTNHPSAERCLSCGRPRADLPHEPIEPRPDWIPDRVVVPPGTVVSLVHEPAAHADPGEAHWQLRVGGQLAGSSARRDGAPALLRATDGSEIVALDVRGTGASTYRLADAIDRFAAPTFPLQVPCPEASTG